MVKAFTPTFTAEDLTKTPNFAAVAKVMMFDMPSAPFTINLPPPMGEPNDDLMNRLKVYSATRFGKTRAEVEAEIKERWNSAQASKNAPESHSEEKTGKIPSSDEEEAPEASKEPEERFLDAWLSKKQQD